LRRVGASGRVGGPEVGGRVLAGQGGPKLLSPLSPSRHPLRQGLRRLVAPPPQQEPRQRHRDQQGQHRLDQHREERQWQQQQEHRQQQAVAQQGVLDHGVHRRLPSRRASHRMLWNHQTAYARAATAPPAPPVTSGGPGTTLATSRPNASATRPPAAAAGRRPETPRQARISSIRNSHAGRISTSQPLISPNVPQPRAAPLASSSTSTAAVVSRPARVRASRSTRPTTRPSWSRRGKSLRGTPPVEPRLEPRPPWRLLVAPVLDGPVLAGSLLVGPLVAPPPRPAGGWLRRPRRAARSRPEPPASWDRAFI